MPTKAKDGRWGGRWRQNQGRIKKDPFLFSRRTGSPGAFQIKRERIPRRSFILKESG